MKLSIASPGTINVAPLPVLLFAPTPVGVEFAAARKRRHARLMSETLTRLERTVVVS